jgi:hypothetical protein
MRPSRTAAHQRSNCRSRLLPIAAGTLAATLMACIGTAAPPSPLPLKLVRDIPLPGHATRFDYESLDPKTGLLFIAHLGDSRVLVFDTNTQKLMAEIPEAHVGNPKRLIIRCLPARTL